MKEWVIEWVIGIGVVVSACRLLSVWRRIEYPSMYGRYSVLRV